MCLYWSAEMLECLLFFLVIHVQVDILVENRGSTFFVLKLT
jgi:hypothetical protein